MPLFAPLIMQGRSTLRRLTTAAALVAALALTPAWAQEPDTLVTDRPDATESTETVARGAFQLESGYTFGRVEGVDVHNLGELLFRVGLAPRLELRIGVNSYQWLRAPSATAEGLEDSMLGIKLKLVDGGGAGLAHPAVAVLASISLPTGSSALSADEPEPELRLAVAWNLSERAGLGANLAYEYTFDVETKRRFHQTAATLALGYALTDRWGTFIEYFGSYQVVARGDREHYADGGFTFLVSDDLQLDARVGYGLNGLDDDYFMGFGTAVRW